MSVAVKGDQVVRIAAAVCVVGVYLGFVGLNGHRPIDVGFVGTMDPFALVILAELTLAFPELLDRLPFGPTRKNG
jgi:hypothetical protein